MSAFGRLNYLLILIWVIAVCYSKYSDNKHRHTSQFRAALIEKLDSTLPTSRKMVLTVKTKGEMSSETCSVILQKKKRHVDGCWISHCISLGLSYTSFSWNGFTVKNTELVKFHEYFYTILTLFYGMWLRS
jgi:hypothetical protein